MTTHALIHQAVRHSTFTGLRSLGNRLFARMAGRVVFAQCWEDAETDLAALQLPPGQRIVTIAAAGCNALAYLSTRPAAVHAVDVNADQLAMLSLKKAALTGLPDYPSLLDFLGNADQLPNLQRYRRHIASLLPVSARQYWERHDWRGQPRYSRFARNAYRHSLPGHIIGLAHGLARLLGKQPASLARANSREEQCSLFEQHIAPALRHPLMRILCRLDSMFYSLGIPPAQLAVLRQQAHGDLPALLEARLRRLACDFPLAGNPYAQQAFARRYRTSQQHGLPLYLQARHYDTLRQHLSRLHSHHQHLTDFLAERPPQSVDAFVLRDIPDWMDTLQLNALWRQITRTAAPGAKVLFRSGGMASPLTGRLAPQLLACWQTDPHANRLLHARDRSALYGGLHLYTKQT